MKLKLAKYERPKPGLYDELIFYCKFGDRSQTAAELAAKVGYRKWDIYNLGLIIQKMQFDC